MSDANEAQPLKERVHMKVNSAGKPLMKRLIVAAAAVLLIGCAASGVKVDERKVESFKPGVTTKAQVVAALGQPTSQMSISDGISTLDYSYAEASTRPSTFIPFVGPFVGGMDSTVSSVRFRFSADGKLMDITKSSMDIGAGMGLSAAQDNRREK
ncbi:MAG: hypothetical protein LBI48_05810 [Burkholderiaceae bacterium]|jgi:outer membrane protein assembly factor BamE (lipoprotein component of BamABCDE complex)|nr:hypothetical protein [Burkholderiaceae bacterium]